jgi:putative ABC transport system ATP-binding protein
VILAKNITHFYDKEKILNDINLKINENEFVILTGESGSGKTTLLSILSTLLKPSIGEVSFGTQIKNLDNFRNQNIGFIFQFHYLIAHLSILENIKIVTKKTNQKILDLLGNLGIKECAYKYPHQISGGQRQRVAIARAIINSPSYIFADEPTGNLDSKNSNIIFDILREVNATIIVATHDKSKIKQSDRKILLKDGLLC